MTETDLETTQPRQPPRQTPRGSVTPRAVDRSAARLNLSRTQMKEGRSAASSSFERVCDTPSGNARPGCCDISPRRRPDGRIKSRNFMNSRAGGCRLHISRAGRGKEALLVITELINQSLTVGNFTIQQNAHPQVTLCCLGSGLSRVKASCGQEGHKILADGRRHTLAAYYVAYASNQFRDTRSGARCKTHQLVPVLSNREGQRENPTPLSA